MCELTSGYTKPACASFGGTKAVVVMNTENITSITKTGNVVSAFTLDGTKSAYRITPDMASIDFTETATRSRENNSLFFATTCTIILKDDTQTTRDLVDLIAKGFITIIQEKENGTNFVYGSVNGLTLTTGAFASGLNYEDLSGVTITMEGKESAIAPSILLANFPTPIV